MIKIFFISLINLVKFFKIDEKKREFVFYSESYFYKDHFVDLIENLIKLNQKNMIYVTSDLNDFNFFKNKLNCFYIGNFFILSLFFSILRCKFMIMTLTDIGNHLKKSKNCQYFVYFFHASASTHYIYTDDAFKNYDIILTNGDYQKKELIEAENRFNFPKKTIVNTGYFFLDFLRNNANLNKKEDRHILFAPTWNYNKKNLFNDYAFQIIEKLIDKNFIVTFRPHPEHLKRSKATLSKILNKFNKNSNFYFDTDSSNLNSLEKAALIITDNSSIVFEFLLVFKRPILYINYSIKLHNLNTHKISDKTLEGSFKKEFGNELNVDNLDKLSDIYDQVSGNENNINEKVNNFNKRYFTNLGNSANIAAKYLITKNNL